MDQDRGLFICLASVLLGFGVLMVHSASMTSRPTEAEQIFLSRHLAFVALGVVAATACSLLPARFWFRAAPWLLLGTIALLFLVRVPGFGARVNGAQRWLRYGSLSLQPAELAKLALPLMLARQLVLRRGQLTHWWRGSIGIVWPIACVVPLVVVQPDLGTSIFLLLGAVAALWAGGWPLRNFLLVGGCAVPAALGLVALKPYQWQRITGFVATWTDLNSAPYQLKQSLVTMGAGGVHGVGLGKGLQKLSFLPEANTDFVFAVVGEELGLVGTFGLVLLWCGLLLAGWRLLRGLPAESFAATAALTLLVQLVLQAMINVAVVTAMVPPKGIPHPLVSYGGTNLLVSLLSLGIILSLARDADAETMSEAVPLDVDARGLAA